MIKTLIRKSVAEEEGIELPVLGGIFEVISERSDEVSKGFEGSQIEAQYCIR